MQNNLIKIITKMTKIRNFWAFFYLTTPYKITIIKRFMLPLLNYIGAVVLPSEEIITQIKNLIISFLCQSRAIVKSKIFSRIEGRG